MTRLTRWPCRPMMFLAAAAWLVGGCGPAPTPAPSAAQVVADHDDHDDGHDHDHEHDADENHTQPETIAAGLDELGRVIEAAKKALAEKNLDDADGHVHMVGHLVDDLHGLVKRSAGCRRKWRPPPRRPLMISTSASTISTRSCTLPMKTCGRRSITRSMGHGWSAAIKALRDLTRRATGRRMPR